MRFYGIYKSSGTSPFNSHTIYAAHLKEWGLPVEEFGMIWARIKDLVVKSILSGLTEMREEFKKSQETRWETLLLTPKGVQEVQMSSVSQSVCLSALCSKAPRP